MSPIMILNDITCILIKKKKIMYERETRTLFSKCTRVVKQAVVLGHVYTKKKYEYISVESELIDAFFSGKTQPTGN